jgi:hypothetical protein
LVEGALVGVRRPLADSQAPFVELSEPKRREMLRLKA